MSDAGNSGFCFVVLPPPPQRFGQETEFLWIWGHRLEMQVCFCEGEPASQGGICVTSGHTWQEKGEEQGGQANKAIAQSGPLLPGPAPISLSILRGWQAGCPSDECFSLPLKFPVTGNRGNGPFCTIYRNKMKAAISPSESSWNVTCRELPCFGNKVVY